MGYPMTWSRVFGRNRMDDDKTWEAFCPQPGLAKIEDIEGALYDAAKKNISAANSRMAALRLDLQRLRDDSIDEGYVAEEISRRTGIDKDTVSAVLLEFFKV